VEMHDCDDVDAVRLDAIQETVGKLRNQNTPEQTAKEPGWASSRSYVRWTVREKSSPSPCDRSS